MGDERAYERVKAARTGLNTIAIWQFLAFVLLLLLIWANELFDFSYWIYGGVRTPPDFFRASILSACVVVVAIINVGHTFLLQTRIISGFIVVCSACHKVKIEHEIWRTLEGYISDHSEVTFSHGLCPDCYEREMAELDKLEGKSPRRIAE